jgi:hypothetical protein
MKFYVKAFLTHQCLLQQATCGSIMAVLEQSAGLNIHTTSTLCKRSPSIVPVILISQKDSITGCLKTINLVKRLPWKLEIIG